MFFIFLSSLFKFLLIQERRQPDEDPCVPLFDQVVLLGGGAKPPESEMRPPCRVRQKQT